MAANTSVLIVEDEPAIVELVSYSLRETGWEIRTAANVASAWDSIVQARPDLLLLDWMLPDQSGLRLLSRLRGDRDCPANADSAEQATSALRACRRAFMDHLLRDSVAIG